jgi:small subunit ribosomal protein S16
MPGGRRLLTLPGSLWNGLIAPVGFAPYCRKQAKQALFSTFFRSFTVAVKLRLMRMGKTKQPTYRLVAADSRAKRDGRFIEILGTYEPRHEPSKINIDNDKIVGYLKTGAQPTETVAKLLKISGAWDTYTASKTAK